MSRQIKVPPDVEAAIPFVGDCTCGTHDSRHRVLDAIVAAWRNGGHEVDIAAERDLPVAVVEAIVRHWNVRWMRWSK